MPITRAEQRSRPSRRRHPRAFTIAIVATLVASAAMLATAYVQLGTNSSSPPGEREGGPLATVAVLDVGQGLSVAVVTADGASLLYDFGGGRSDSEDVLLPFLQEHGADQIDFAILSHPHQDHVGGLPAILEEMPVARFIDPVIETTNQTYLQSLEMVEEREIDAVMARREDEYQLGEYVDLEILWPTDDLLTDSDGLHRINDNSTVVRLTIGEIEILLTGDIETDAEAALVDDYGREMAVDILQVAHHGSNTSSQKAFLEAFDPEIGIIPVGVDNQYGHPHAEAIQRLRRNDVAIYRTDVDGTVIIETDGNTYEIRTTRTDQSWTTRDYSLRWTISNPIPMGSVSRYWSSTMASN